jgi:hypothetical protein
MNQFFPYAEPHEILVQPSLQSDECSQEPLIQENREEPVWKLVWVCGNSFHLEVSSSENISNDACIDKQEFASSIFMGLEPEIHE